MKHLVNTYFFPLIQGYVCSREVIIISRELKERFIRARIPVQRNAPIVVMIIDSRTDEDETRLSTPARLISQMMAADLEEIPHFRLFLARLCLWIPLALLDPFLLSSHRHR